MDEPKTERKIVEIDGELYKLVTFGNQTMIFKRVILEHWEKVAVYDSIEDTWDV